MQLQLEKVSFSTDPIERVKNINPLSVNEYLELFYLEDLFNDHIKKQEQLSSFAVDEKKTEVKQVKKQEKKVETKKEDKSSFSSYSEYY